MGVVKPTGASHKAEISQYLWIFHLSVFLLPPFSAKKQQQQKNFCHSSNCNSIFFSFCISSSLWGWGQERRRMCVLKSTHNQCTCRYLVSYIYKLSSEATSAGEEKKQSEYETWSEISFIDPPHSSIHCRAGQRNPGSLWPITPVKPCPHIAFCAVRSQDVPPLQSHTKHHLIKLCFQLSSRGMHGLSKARRHSPLHRGAELQCCLTFRLLWLNFDLVSQAVCVLESLWLAA